MLSFHIFFLYIFVLYHHLIIISCSTWHSWQKILSCYELSCYLSWLDLLCSSYQIDLPIRLSMHSNHLRCAASIVLHAAVPLILSKSYKLPFQKFNVNSILYLEQFFYGIPIGWSCFVVTYCFAFEEVI